MYLEDMRKGAESYFKSMQSARLKKQKELEEQRINTERANALLGDSQVEAGTHQRNPDGSVTRKSPSFWDYLNPIGEHGIFGQRNTAQVARDAGIAGDFVRKKVDQFLGEEGNDKFDSGKDVARFAINLLPGMVEGLASSGKNFNEAIRGQRVNFDEQGNMLDETEKLSGRQRFAAGVVGGLDTGGLLLGGSGKFFKELLKAPLKSALKSGVVETVEGVTKYAGNKAAKNALITGAKGMAKNSFTEGVEESVQSFAEDFQDDSRLSDDWLSTAGKSFALGAAGGSIFDVSGRAISFSKSKIANRGKVDEAQGGDSTTATTKPKEATPTTDPITPEKLERLRRVDGIMNQRLVEIEKAEAGLRDNSDPSVKRIIASDGTDVTAVAQSYDNQVRELETQIRDLQGQAEGKNVNGRAEMPDQATGKGGKPTLNVGLNIGDKTALTPDQVKSILKEEFDVDVTNSTVQDSNTEPTYIPELSRALTQDELYRLSELTQQDAIAHHTGEAGMLAGPKAADWGGEFNPDYFMGTDGTSYSSRMDPSQYTGDVEGRAKAAEKIPELRQKIEDLRAEQAEKFEMLGGTQEVIDTQAVRAKAAELKRQKAEVYDWKIRNNLGETVESLSQLKADLENGIVSDQFVKMREPVSSIEGAVALARDSDHNDTSSIQRAAVINQLHREAAQRKMDSLWTQEKADKFEFELDENYKLAEEQLNEYPGPKREELLLQLQEDYNAQRIENQTRVFEDMEDVEATQRALEIADDIDARIVDRANSILASNPAVFGEVNPEEMIEIQSAVDVALTLKKAEAAPETISPIESESAVTQAIRNAADAEEAGVIIDEDPRLSDQASTVIADQLGDGNLKGELRDTFFTTVRNALLKLQNGDKLVGELDYALMEMAKSDDVMKVRANIDKWSIAYKTKEATDQSIAFWDQGQELTQLKGESNKRFAQRQRAVNSVKEYFDDAAKRRGLRTNAEADAMVADLESQRTEENSAEIDAQIREVNSKRKLDNYFAHIFDDPAMKDIEGVAEALARLESGINAHGNKLTENQRNKLLAKVAGIDLGTQQIIAKKGIYKVGKDGHAIKREGAEGWSRDIPFVLEMYQRSTNRAVYMQPALDNIKSMTSTLGETQREFVEDALNAVTGKKSRADRRLGDKVAKTLSTSRRFSNMALMGASVRTVMLQPTAILNNWRLASNEGMSSAQFVKSTLKALKAANVPLRHSPALQEFLMAGGMQGSWSTNLNAGKLSKAESAMFGGITLMDRNLRFAAYDMGKESYLKNNAKDPKNPTDAEYNAAKKAGVAAAQEAQFGLGPMDVPLAQTTEVGKSIFQLQQFNMKQTALEISYIIGDKDGSLIKLEKDANGKVVGGKFTAKGAKNLLKTVAGYSAIFYMYTQFQVGDDEDSKNPFGLEFEDLIPFGEQVSALVELATTGKVEGEVQTPLPPVFTAIFGRGGQDKGVGGHLFKALTGGDDVDRGDELSSSLQSAIRQFMPMGTQLNRTYQGGKAVVEGESQNKSGSTRFLVDNSSGWNIMKGLVAGQYATTEGQEWLRNGMNTIPKNKTIEFQGKRMPVSEFVRDHIQDPAMKAQFIGYYSAQQNANKELQKVGKSTTEVVKDIRLRLTAGRISQAEANAEIEEHNQIIRELYRPYFEGNKNVPKYVTMDFLDSVMVGEAKPYSFQDDENSELLEEFAQ